MKDKLFRKKVIVGGSVVLVTIIIIMAIMIGNKTELSDDIVSDNFELTKDYDDDIRASGNIENVTNIKVTEIAENNEEFLKYKDIVEEMKKDSRQDIKKVIVCEISLFDENNKEVVLQSPITVYFYPEYISAYDGLYTSYIINEDGNFEYINAPVYAVTSTTIYAELNKSSTIVFLNYGEPINNPYINEEKGEGYVEEVPELEPMGGEDEKWIINISEGYEVPEISIEQAKEKYNISNSALVDGINRMNDFDGIVINMATATKTYDENFLTTSVDMLSAYNTLIYLNDKKDITMNYLNNDAKENFLDVFNFNYKECNGAFDVFYELLKNQGLYIDFDNATFNKEFYAIANIREYKIDNSEEILKNFLQNIKYDELIEARVLYNITQINDIHINSTVNFIDKVSVEIYYKQDGIIKSNSWAYTLTITTEEELNNMLENKNNFE